MWQDEQARQTFVLEQARQQAVQLGQATVAMPTRVEQMSSTLLGLEGGEIKLRVRALEVERAARRASIMQVLQNDGRHISGCWNRHLTQSLVHALTSTHACSVYFCACADCHGPVCCVCHIGECRQSASSHQPPWLCHNALQRQ